MDGKSEAAEQELRVLISDKENEKLLTVLCNYLSLGQFELARTVLDQLFDTSPERVTHVLRAIVLQKTPHSWFAAVPPVACILSLCVRHARLEKKSCAV